MSKIGVAAVLVAVGIVVAGVAVAPPGGKGGAAAAPGRVLYKVEPGATPAQLGALNAVVRGRGLTKVRKLKGLGIDVARIGRGAAKDVCAELVATGAVAFAEPDALVEPVAVPNDPLYGSQWQHPKINSPGAWDTTTGSQTILAAVCDTGVESTHEDLAANLQLPGYNSADGTTNSEPIHWHGTSVAGCIGAVGNNGKGVAGVSWNVKILPIRITNRGDGLAFVSDAADAIRYAADHGAKVANLSYLMAGYSSIASAGQYLRDRGGLLFVAAGNDNQDPGWTDFASFVCVGSTDQNDNRSSFSNYGAYIDCVAPGSSVLSTYTLDRYATVSGTSFSSPITAGLATLIYALNPSYTPTEVENFILNTCVDLGDPGDDNTFGHGRINAAAAVAAAANTTPNT
ncbi:S8 family serine peptidase, partial [Planctomycetota bacterium]